MNCSSRIRREADVCSRSRIGGTPQLQPHRRRNPHQGMLRQRNVRHYLVTSQQGGIQPVLELGLSLGIANRRSRYRSHRRADGVCRDVAERPFRGRVTPVT